MSQEQSRGRIVVGIDGAPSSVRALQWALKQAEATGAEVEAVHAWQVPASFGMAVPTTIGEGWAESAEESLEKVLAQDTDGSVPIKRWIVEGYPAKVLLERSKDAGLLVVGNRGHGGLVEALLGSVSQHCIQHATCPVVVVR
ncbi:universal stress protein [Glycomyces salinus]|uniref:universal stress protein n=1 Tax=Glycomyces salinus TaxID=980294 RepID=UPI0018EB6B47|nr:universal stress protein [Glycomyces salinus]